MRPKPFLSPRSPLHRRGLFSAAAGAWSEHEQDRVNAFLKHWLKMLEDEMREKQQTIVSGAGSTCFRPMVERVKLRAAANGPRYIPNGLLIECLSWPRAQWIAQLAGVPDASA
jgi:hypothetical protein